MSSALNLGKIEPHKRNFGDNWQTSELKDGAKMTCELTVQHPSRNIVNAESELRDIAMDPITPPST